MNIQISNSRHYNRIQRKVQVKIKEIIQHKSATVPMDLDLGPGSGLQVPFKEL